MNRNNSQKSLLDGRNVAPLDQQQIKRAANTFIGLDNKVNARYEANSSTKFVIATDDNNEEYGEIVFSDDIYPGSSVANPNSVLSMKSAATHELAHYHRWHNKTELPHGHLIHIDEAMTSLEAALRYFRHLDETDLQGLIADSLQRLSLFVDEQQRLEHVPVTDNVIADKRQPSSQQILDSLNEVYANGPTDDELEHLRQMSASQRRLAESE